MHSDGTPAHAEQSQDNPTLLEENSGGGGAPAGQTLPIVEHSSAPAPRTSMQVAAGFGEMNRGGTLQSSRQKICPSHPVPSARGSQP